jgi:hypothetical protein
VVVVIFAPLIGVTAAVTLAIGFYWGREKRDHEIKLGLPQSQVWWRGFCPFVYGRDGLLDFWIPALGVGIFAILWRVFNA